MESGRRENLNCGNRIVFVEFTYVGGAGDHAHTIYIYLWNLIMSHPIEISSFSHSVVNVVFRRILYFSVEGAAIASCLFQGKTSSGRVMVPIQFPVTITYQSTLLAERFLGSLRRRGRAVRGKLLPSHRLDSSPSIPSIVAEIEVVFTKNTTRMSMLLPGHLEVDRTRLVKRNLVECYGDTF